ncbi:hypothetical protein VWM68_11155, partial [Campylobacter coli]
RGIVEGVVALVRQEIGAVASFKIATVVSALPKTRSGKILRKNSKFDPRDLKDYVENGFYKGKAGAIMCEGFHKNYIIKQEGNLN